MNRYVDRALHPGESGLQVHPAPSRAFELRSHILDHLQRRFGDENLRSSQHTLRRPRLLYVRRRAVARTSSPRTSRVLINAFERLDVEGRAEIFRGAAKIVEPSLKPCLSSRVT